MKKIFTTVLVLLTVLSGLLVAQNSPMVVADQIGTKSPLYYNHTPNIARSSDGVLAVAWKSAEKQIVYSVYDASFQQWSPAVNLSSAGDAADKAGLAADDAGNIFAVWQQRETSAEDYAIFFSKYDGTSWTTPVNLTGNGVENEEASVICDDLGNVFVAWNTDGEKDTTNYVLCIKSTDKGANWSDPDTLSSMDGNIGGTSTTSGRPFLAAGKSGKLVCAWHEEPDGHPDRESFINQYDGTSWLGELAYIDVADSANSMYPTVAMDSNDQIYMAYISFLPTEKMVLKKKAWGAADWNAGADTLLTDTQVTKPYFGVDEFDSIYLVFRRDIAADTLNGLEEVAYMTSADFGVTWSEPKVLSRPNHDAGYVTLTPNIRSTGVDVLWRESSSENVDDEATTAVVYGRIGIVTSINNDEPAVINNFRLEQNYPNPFNPQTSIAYTLPVNGHVTLTVYNLLGQKVRMLVNASQKAGEHSISFKAEGLSSGLYFYQLKSEGVSLTKKMIIMQ